MCLLEIFELAMIDVGLQAYVSSPLTELQRSFRSGVVLGTERTLTRAEAIEFGSVVADAAPELISRWKAFFEKEKLPFHIEETDAQVFTAGNVVVRFPDVVTLLDGAHVVFGASSTVCQGTLHSKSWVRCSSGADNPRVGKLSQKLRVLLSDLYAERYSEFVGIPEGVKLKQLHEFLIGSIDVDDPAFIDVYAEVMKTGRVDNLVNQNKFRSLAKLYEVAHLNARPGHDAPEQVIQAWEEWFSKEFSDVLVPESDVHKGVFLMRIDPEQELTTCFGVSSEFALGPDPYIDDRLHPSSHFTSAKIASVLASNL